MLISAVQQSDSVYIYINYFIFFSITGFSFFSSAALGLHCCVQAFSNCSEWGLLFVVVHGFLIAVASLVVGHGL